MGNPHEAIRVNEATEHNVRAWFNTFSTYRDKYRVKNINIHNMDEHGLCIGKINPKKVVGAAKDQWGLPRKRTKMRNSQSREWVSIVECISAGQTSIQPLIIFKGVHVNINWAPNQPPSYKYTADPSAWMNDTIAIWWLNEIFIPQTRPRGAEYRILIFDQHTTHLSDEFEKACKKQRIITLPLPAHTSDVLQPLDLVMFSPLKGKYKDKLYELCQLNDGDDTKKKYFCHLYHEARQESFHASNIQSAFKKAGLVPYDPEGVIQRPDVIKTIQISTEQQLIDKPPRVHDVKYLENALYQIKQENQSSMTSKLEMSTWIATKAIEALSSKSVELAQQQLKYNTLEHKHKTLLQKRGTRKVPPKRGHHLVDAEDIMAKQKEWDKENKRPPPRQSASTRMKK